MKKRTYEFDNTNEKQNKRGNPDRLKSVKNRVETKKVEIQKTITDKQRNNREEAFYFFAVLTAE